MTTASRLARAMLVCVIGAWMPGCSIGVPEAKIAPAADEGAVCGPKDGKPPTAPTLIYHGNRFRDVGLRQLADAKLPGAGSDEFSAAAQCYQLALGLAPDSYEAKLGLGVTFLGRARALGKQEETSFKYRSFMTAAKKDLGEAYMLRQGPFEALYYLAEVATLERDFARAKIMLEPLHAVRAKAGPVAALLGYIASEEHDEASSYRFYQEALESGGPYETLVFVSNKLELEHRR